MNCQVCGGAIELSEEDYIYISDSFKKIFPKIIIGQCKQCGLWQVNIEDSVENQKTLHNYYKSQYRESDDPPDIGDRTNIYWKRGLGIANIVKKYSVHIETCFEKGAGYGFNLLAIKEAYPAVKLYTDEIDEHVKIYLKDIKKNSLHEKRIYDLIIISHVFEHLLNCNKTIDTCYERLMHKGLLYIEVPNSLRFIEPHITFWTPSSLLNYYNRYLSEKFEMIELYSHGYPQNYRNIVEKFFYKGLGHIISPEKAMNVRFSNGVFLTLLLRKR